MANEPDKINASTISLSEQREIELQRFKAIIETSDDAIISKTMDGIIKSWNRGAERIFGYTAEEVIDKPMTIFFPQDRLDEESNILLRISRGERVEHFETVRVCKDGRLVDISATISPISDTHGKIVGVSKIARDITERIKATEELKRLNEILVRQATSDPLTGIANRTKFNEVLEIEMARSRRFALPLSLIMIDIDRFKTINDTYGHNAGDNVLREFASRVSKSIRKNDLFTRWGGEEFMILVTNVTRSGTVIFAEKLRLEIETFDFSPFGRITCSFGVTEFEKNDTIDSFIKKVDIALYRAKSAGRNRVESS
jgi:diguanylate cyclase (GGDEF)-like protein/PAS domain S-box-containing protein